MNLQHGRWRRLGECIRDSRDAMGLTQRELCDLAGIKSTTTLVAFESGRPHSRWPLTLADLERSLGWAVGTARRIVMGEQDRPEDDAPPIGPMTAGEKERFREMVRGSTRLSRAAKQAMLEEIDAAPTVD